MRQPCSSCGRARCRCTLRSRDALAWSDRTGGMVTPPFGVTNVLSLDVHFGLPRPSFTARPLRLAIQASLAAGACSRALVTPLSSNGRLSRNPGAGATGPAALVMPPFGAAHALSLDVHFGPPGPSFTARPLRFAIRASLAAGARSRARATTLSLNGRLSRKPGAGATGPAGGSNTSAFRAFQQFDICSGPPITIIGENQVIRP